MHLIINTKKLILIGSLPWCISSNAHNLHYASTLSSMGLGKSKV